MKKVFMIFVCGFFLLPLSAFALADVQSNLIPYGDDGLSQIPRNEKPVLSQIPRFYGNDDIDMSGKVYQNEKPIIRQNRNMIRQSESRADRLRKQLTQVHEQIKRLQKRASEIKKQLSEVKDDEEIDFKIWDPRPPMMQNMKPGLRQSEGTEIDESGEMMEEGKRPRRTIQQRIRRNSGEDAEEKEEMKMDVTIFSPDQEKVRERSSKAQSKLSRFRSFFRLRR